MLKNSWSGLEGKVQSAMQRERRCWDEDEIGYHRRRAEEELEIARQAQCPSGRRFHYHLAALHLDRAYGPAPFMMQVA